MPYLHRPRRRERWKVNTYLGELRTESGHHIVARVVVLGGGLRQLKLEVSPDAKGLGLSQSDTMKLADLCMAALGPVPNDETCKHGVGPVRACGLCNPRRGKAAQP